MSWRCSVWLNSCAWNFKCLCLNNFSVIDWKLVYTSNIFRESQYIVSISRHPASVIQRTCQCVLKSFTLHFMVKKSRCLLFQVSRPLFHFGSNFNVKNYDDKINPQKGWIWILSVGKYRSGQFSDHKVFNSSEKKNTFLFTIYYIKYSKLYPHSQFDPSLPKLEWNFYACKITAFSFSFDYAIKCKMSNFIDSDWT